MTLIVSVATQEHVVQVSDRRLMDVRDPDNPRIISDDLNKNVFWNLDIAFGYTGLAYIGNKKTDEWLTKILAESKLKKDDEVLNLIETKATEEFNKLHYPGKYLPHTFVGAGWIRKTDGIHPVIFEITNVPDENQPLQTGKIKFKAVGHCLERSENIFIRETGQSSKKEMRREFYRLLKKVVRRAQSSRPIIRCVVQHMREVASINPKVGKDLLVVVIPQKSLNNFTEIEGARVRFFLNDSPNKDTATFLYIPEGSDNGIQHGPNVVSGGFWGTELKVGSNPKRP